MGIDVIVIITLMQILSIDQDRHGERFFVHCKENNYYKENALHVVCLTTKEGSMSYHIGKTLR